ncbi:hypothetical protein O5171_15800 [Escherichia coli]|nr:hypothetical protein [Escherichia coli]
MTDKRNILSPRKNAGRKRENINMRPVLPVSIQKYRKSLGVTNQFFFPPRPIGFFGDFGETDLCLAWAFLFLFSHVASSLINFLFPFFHFYFLKGPPTPFSFFFSSPPPLSLLLPLSPARTSSIPHPPHTIFLLSDFLCFFLELSLLEIFFFSGGIFFFFLFFSSIPVFLINRKTGRREKNSTPVLSIPFFSHYPFFLKKIKSRKDIVIISFLFSPPLLGHPFFHHHFIPPPANDYFFFLGVVFFL